MAVAVAVKGRWWWQWWQRYVRAIIVFSPRVIQYSHRSSFQPVL